MIPKALTPANSSGNRTSHTPGKKPTYVRTVVDYREQKADPYRVRNTVGGNLIDFPGYVSTKGADLVTSKILMNDIISDPKGKATCS
jgi:hypothetical protein